MPNPQDILDLEHRYWETMAAGEHGKSAELLADEAVVVGSMGAHAFRKADYEAMSQQSGWAITSYDLSDEKVTFPTENCAVVTYKVKQEAEHKGKPMSMEAWNSTVWVKDGGDWKCVAHSESPAGQGGEPGMNA